MDPAVPESDSSTDRIDEEVEQVVSQLDRLDFQSLEGHVAELIADQANSDFEQLTKRHDDADGLAALMLATSQAHRRAELIVEHADRQLRAAQDQMARSKRGAERRHAWLAEQLQAFAGLHYSRTRSKHMDLADGTRVQIRHFKPELRVTNAAAVIHWLMEHDETTAQALIKREPTLDGRGAKAYVNEVLKKSGETLPGTEYVEERWTSTVTHHDA